MPFPQVLLSWLPQFTNTSPFLSQAPPFRPSWWRGWKFRLKQFPRARSRPFGREAWLRYFSTLTQHFSPSRSAPFPPRISWVHKLVWSFYSRLLISEMITSTCTTCCLTFPSILVYREKWNIVHGDKQNVPASLWPFAYTVVVNE